MKKGIDPIRFLDMTYPQVMCILTEDDSDRADSVEVRAKRILKDFKAGKFGSKQE